MLLLVALLGACAGEAGHAGRARPRFEGERAFALIQRQVAFGPRVPGSEGHRAMQAWLGDELRARGAVVEVDRFEAAGLPLVNVVGRYRPELVERVMLFAHWDTRPVADRDPDPALRKTPIAGANDGASGVAVLLELARLFQAAPPPLGVDVVFLDGEDYGEFGLRWTHVLLGSQRFARTYRGPRPRYGILLDMVGDADLRIPREQNSMACCPRTMDRIWQVAAELGHATVFVDEPGPPVLDDHIPLNRAALGVVDLIDLNYPPWHTTADTPDRTSARSLAVVGEVVAEVIYREPPAVR